MSPIGSDQCPICRVNYKGIERIGMDAYRIECVRCGVYEMSMLVIASLKDQTELLPYLSAHTRQAWEFDRRNNSAGREELARTCRIPSAHVGSSKGRKTVAA